MRNGHGEGTLLTGQQAGRSSRQTDQIAFEAAAQVPGRSVEPRQRSQIAPKTPLDARTRRLMASLEEYGRKHPTYCCVACGAVNINPNDVRERYCGRCHTFEDLNAISSRLPRL